MCISLSIGIKFKAFFPLLSLGHETSFDGIRQKRGLRKFHFCFICTNFSVFLLKRYWKNVGKVNIIMDSWIGKERERAEIVPFPVCRLQRKKKSLKTFVSNLSCLSFYWIIFSAFFVGLISDSKHCFLLLSNCIPHLAWQPELS